MNKSQERASLWRGSTEHRGDGVQWLEEKWKVHFDPGSFFLTGKFQLRGKQPGFCFYPTPGLPTCLPTIHRHSIQLS